MLRLIVVILIWRGLSFGQASSVEEAWKLVGSGRRGEAVQVLKEAIRRNPNDPDARLLLGSLLSEAGHQEDAIAQLTEAVRLRPHSAAAQNALGEAYSSAGDRQSARHSFEEAIAIDAGSGVAQLNLGRVLLESQQFDAAAPHLDRAIETLGRDLDAANAHYLRAKVYSAHNEFRQAAEQLQEALAIHSSFPEAWSDLGEARRILLDHADAIAALRRAIELAPNDSVAQYRLGEEYLVEHQPHLAVAVLRQADRLNPNDQSILNALLKALKQDGQAGAGDEVKRRLAGLLSQRELDARNELDAVKLNNEGAKLQSTGDLVGAIGKYAAAVKLAPRNVPMRVNYAIAMLRLGKWTDGLNELHQCLVLDPDNAKIKAALRDALAQAPAGVVPQWADRNHF
jgi:tetratricopeptide (TPR) repeat protein